MIQDLPDEIWLPIANYENLYSVSNKGRVKAHNKQWVWNRSRWEILTKKEEHILIPSITNGYYRLSLCKNGEAVLKTVHRLVATAFKPNPQNKSQVNHKDGNKLNNNDWNLEWATPAENFQHALKNGLVSVGDKHPSARKIKCDTLNIEFGTIRKAANDLGLREGAIWKVLNNEQRFVEGMSFRYL